MLSNKFVVILCLISTFACFTEAIKRGVMPWMCLERCGEDIDSDLAEIIKLGPTVFPAVSIEAYDLDWGANIKDCGYSRVGPKLVKAGIMVQPMITTANIGKLRDLWQNPNQFITQAVKVARENKAWISGFNVDFEPEGGDDPTHDDAVHYAKFLDAFAKALHAEGFHLTVDIATWCELWDDDLLAKTAVDRFITMQTYTAGLETFTSLVKKMHSTYGTAKSGIGLYTEGGFSASDIKTRINIVKSYGIDTIGIWEAPVPSSWTPYIKSFVNDP